MDSVPDHQPLPLSHAVAFNIRAGDKDKVAAEDKAGKAVSEGGPNANPAEDKSAAGATGAEGAAAAAAAAALSAAEVASGKRWSAKVLLLSGVPEAGLHTQDFKLFQVRGWEDGRAGWLWEG